MNRLALLVCAALASAATLAGAWGAHTALSANGRSATYVVAHSAGWQ
ncbi:hypothetical protein [Streptomyces sp. NPDC002078]